MDDVDDVDITVYPSNFNCDDGVCPDEQSGYVGRVPRQKTACSTAEMLDIMHNIIRNRKAQRTIPREILDKHFKEIAKLRFNPSILPRDIEKELDDLFEEVTGFDNRHSPDIYRRIALCALLLANAAETGKW